MTVKEMIENLKKMPQDLVVVYSVDDEGNAYHKIHHTPGIGKFDGYDFVSKDDEAYKEYEGDEVVCVN